MYHCEIAVSSPIEHFVPRIIPDLTVNCTSRAIKFQGLSAALVVGAAALRYERPCASTLEVGNSMWGYSCIARELAIVDPETVALGIRIDKETSLEEGIWRRLDVRDQVGRREGQLNVPSVLRY